MDDGHACHERLFHIRTLLEPQSICLYITKRSLWVFTFSMKGAVGSVLCSQEDFAIGLSCCYRKSLQVSNSANSALYWVLGTHSTFLQVSILGDICARESKECLLRGVTLSVSFSGLIMPYVAWRNFSCLKMIGWLVHTWEKRTTSDIVRESSDICVIQAMWAPQVPRRREHWLSKYERWFAGRRDLKHSTVHVGANARAG